MHVGLGERLVGGHPALGRRTSRGAGRSGRCRRPGRRSRLPSRSSAIAVHSMCQPGRPAPQRRVPARLVRSLQPPDQTVQRILLARSVRVAAALGEDRRAPRPRSRWDSDPNVGVGGPGEVEIGVVGVVDRVDRALGLQRPRSARRPAGSTRPRRRSRRGEHVQRGHVLRNSSIWSAQLLPVDPRRGRPLQQRVVDVGDVLHVVDVEPGVAPDPVQQVEGDVGVGVPMWVASYGVMPQT